MVLGHLAHSWQVFVKWIWIWGSMRFQLEFLSKLIVIINLGFWVKLKLGVISYWYKLKWGYWMRSLDSVLHLWERCLLVWLGWWRKDSVILSQVWPQNIRRLPKTPSNATISSCFPWTKAAISWKVLWCHQCRGADSSIYHLWKNTLIIHCFN